MPLHPFNSARPPDLFPLDLSPRSLLQEYTLPSEEQETRPNVLSFSENVHGILLAKLEAVLFLSREPLSGHRLSQYAELPEGTRIRSLVKDLNQDYDDRQCAFRVVEVAGGFQLRTRPQLASWLIRRQEVPTTVQLSVSALETLAVIAYRQPVLRAEVERIRGVQCGELIRQLLERGFVKIVGRSEELGRPFFYGTTKNFLQVFGLGSLQELPGRDRLVPTTP
jgi:segregation and condensation protein B